ncbi:MAG TPA: lycopene cyclase domain-containing protein [Jatrophihabitans sp.]|nr:lycopene cyclase domain-containing protein [Jatrophihabitans sp.]
MTYTVAVLLAVLAAVALDMAVLRTSLLTRRAFWTAYAIVLAGQLVVNGLLTGRKIVTYDPAVIIGWRVAFAPVEDLLFGFALVVTTLSLWVWWGRRAARRGVPPVSAGRRRVPPPPVGRDRRAPGR